MDTLEKLVEQGTRVALVDSPIGPSVLAAFQRSQAGAGAVGSFSGIIRADKSGVAEVTAITYSAYRGMAEKILKEMQREILQQYELLDLLIFHSLGEVKSGESSMLVAVAAKHRKAAFRALEETVERIKAEAPVWKQEYYTDGSHQWVGSAKI